VRRVGELARLDDEVPDADPHRAEHVAEVEPDARDVAAAALAALAAGQREDRRRPLGLGIGQLERAGGGLGCERIGAVGREPARLQPPRLRARQPGDAGVRAAAVGEHVEPVAGAGDRVRLGARQMQHAVARPYAVGVPVLPAEALAGEDVEQLLLVAVHVHRHRALARREPVAAEAGARRSRRGSEPPARAAQVTVVDRDRLDVVPVHEQRLRGSFRLTPARIGKVPERGCA
jgi:hypothetical protein